ncbi:MAG: 3-dehydroquinate synthase [Rhodospirillaceae bacterium]|jgi:3-dehydroquinate synthase|nr:3-dehydroquinate synthase [Rhodospirillaceae bacterium]MBT5664491.1 3-dehydroquinate synthase [Rhodospirillaceae bacterium]MBT5809652.1 3-dehydroquinate synthase [Rhodospirillaceae bacterium]
MNTRETVTVALGDRSYDIVVGDGVLAQAGALIAPVLRQPKTIIVTDENVAMRHLEMLQRSLENAGIAHDCIVLPPGDQTKNFNQLQSLIDALLSRGIERSSTIIALGGGMIGDLAGFAAGVTLRGLNYIQIPTTLLAQVDSSVGGKTAINAPQGKNLIGVFHQPRLVLADVGVLDTLPHRELLAGYAEVVKYGLINDLEFFAWLEGHAAALLDGNLEARRIAVVKSCQSKASVVAADERETGMRALLNFGHTFGHALEAEAGYGDTLLHGEGVAIGMAMAFDLSVLKGLCDAEDADRVHRHLSTLGLGFGLEHAQGMIWDPERLIGHMQKDKKVQDGKLTFILTRGIGEAFVSQDVSREELLSVLEETIAA